MRNPQSKQRFGGLTFRPLGRGRRWNPCPALSGPDGVSLGLLAPRLLQSALLFFVFCKLQGYWGNPEPGPVEPVEPQGAEQRTGRSSRPVWIFLGLRSGFRARHAGSSCISDSVQLQVLDSRITEIRGTCFGVLITRGSYCLGSIVIPFQNSTKFQSTQSVSGGFGTEASSVRKDCPGSIHVNQCYR